MPDDLPDISQNLDDPLPQVDPNSQLVPYRMSRTDAGQPVVTTGYGPRARPPIQPPAGFGGGVGMPSLDQIYQAAFSKLPVEQAVQAVEAATRYIGLRGYEQALARGDSPEKALTTYGPMILKSGVGLPEILQGRMQQARLTAPPSAQQMIQNRLNQSKFDAARAEEKAKAEAALRMTPYQQAEIDLRKQAAEDARKKEKKATVTLPLDPDNPDGAKITGPADDPDVKQALDKRDEAIRKSKEPPPKEPGLLEKAKEFFSPRPSAVAPTPKDAVLPYPKSKKDAVTGAIYNTKNGPMRWNGEKFVPVQF